MGKAKTKKIKNTFRHNPLAKEILESRYSQPSSRQKIRNKDSKDDKCADALASGILKIASEQQQEEETDRQQQEETDRFSTSDVTLHSSLDSNDLSQNEDVEEEEYSNSNSEDEKISQTAVEISEEEEEAFKKFNCAGLQERKTLADTIKEILTEKKTEICTAYSDAETDVLTENEEAYKEIAVVLKNYRSGKLPKEFKLFPNFFDWESRLCHTKPDEWSSAAMFQAARIFSSNLGDKGAQRFFNKILLPRCRDEIAESKFLNFHLYQALKKALFKPSAFFKGIIIPLCKDSYCTRREATIFGSILAKCSIPVLHSSAALLTIAALNYQASNSIFMRTLIEKKYALPHRVVNGVVDHFLLFMENKTEVHLVWHHCLLTFVQMYKIDISAEQKSSLLKLLSVHHHEHVTPEIRKELQETVKLSNAVRQMWKF